MMYPRKDNTLSLLGGAIAGAVAMYLLDPETGQRRRREIADRAGEAAHRAGEALEPIWDRVSDTATRVGTAVAGGAGAVGQRIAERYADARDGHPARHVSEHVSHLGEAIADKFRSAGQGARNFAARPASYFQREEPSHTGAYAATGLGTLVLGAGLMYFLDPQRGRQRRAQAIEQATSIVNRTGRSFARMGRDLRNRAKGYAHQARGYVEPEDAVSAERLSERIRSEIGHVVSHTGAIEVMTDNHGRCTLHGKVLASEADRLIATVKGVSGVNEVINLLSVKTTEQEMQEANPATSQQVPQL